MAEKIGFVHYSKDKKWLRIRIEKPVTLKENYITYLVIPVERLEKEGIAGVYVKYRELPEKLQKVTKVSYTEDFKKEILEKLEQLEKRIKKLEELAEE